jgi:hypothetical protein
MMFARTGVCATKTSERDRLNRCASWPWSLGHVGSVEPNPLVAVVSFQSPGKTHALRALAAVLGNLHTPTPTYQSKRHQRSLFKACCCTHCVGRGHANRHTRTGAPRNLQARHGSISKCHTILRLVFHDLSTRRERTDISRVSPHHIGVPCSLKRKCPERAQQDISASFGLLNWDRP